MFEKNLNQRKALTYDHMTKFNSSKLLKGYKKKCQAFMVSLSVKLLCQALSRQVELKTTMPVMPVACFFSSS